jgi:hypothetical protein
MSNDSGSYTFLKDKSLKEYADQKFKESSEMMIKEWHD